MVLQYVGFHFSQADFTDQYRRVTNPLSACFIENTLLLVYYLSNLFTGKALCISGLLGFSFLITDYKVSCAIEFDRKCIYYVIRAEIYSDAGVWPHAWKCNTATAVPVMMQCLTS